MRTTTTKLALAALVFSAMASAGAQSTNSWSRLEHQFDVQVPGHDGGVTCAASAVRQSYVFTGGADGTINAWDVSTSECLWSSEPHDTAVTAIAVARTGVLVASGDASGVVMFGDTESHGDGFLALGTHTSPVSAVSASPGGRTVASGDSTGTVVLWNTVDRKRIGALEASRCRITGLGISPGGTYLVTASSDSNVTVWRTASLERLQTFHLESGCGYQIIVGRDARGMNVVADSGRLVTYELDESSKSYVRSGRTPAVSLLRRPLAVAFGAARVRIIEGMPYFDEAVVAKSLAPGRMYGVLGRTRAHDANLLPSRGKVIISTLSGVDVFDTPGGELLHHFPIRLGRMLSNVAVTPDSSAIVLPHARRDSVLVVRDLESGIAIRDFHGVGGPLTSLNLSDDGTLLVATTAHDDSAHVWDAETGELIRRLGPLGTAQSKRLVITRGDMLVCMNYSRGSAATDGAPTTLWNLRTGECTWRGAAGGASEFCTDLTEDGQYLLVPRDFSTVDVRRTSDGERVGSAHHGSTRVLGFHRTKAGGRLVTTSMDSTLRLWSLPEGRLLRSHRVAEPAVDCYFVHDDRCVITLVRQRGSRVYARDTETLELVTSFRAPYPIDYYWTAPGGWFYFLDARRCLVRVYGVTGE